MVQQHVQVRQYNVQLEPINAEILQSLNGKRLPSMGDMSSSIVELTFTSDDTKNTSGGRIW